jgi:two-component system chemotaxis response regulator CheV
MDDLQNDVDERSHLTESNKFEMLVFRLGLAADAGRSELYGMNVFKIREIVRMSPVTAIADSLPHMLGVVNLRGEMIPVIDLPSLVGCIPETGLNTLIVTEFARSTQAFAVEEVEDIVRLEWSDVLSAEGCVAGTSITSFARLDGNVPHTRLAQVLDVEAIVCPMAPDDGLSNVDTGHLGIGLNLHPDAVILAADDSLLARRLIEQTLATLGIPVVMTKTGKEAWERLNTLADAAEAEGQTVRDKVALVLSDLEMPEMDGFTLTRLIKKCQRFNAIPVVIHSSLSGAANEELVKRTGADAYVAKFAANELGATIRTVVRPLS